MSDLGIRVDSVWADPHECHCICHQPRGNAMHFTACCHPCPTCGRRIKTLFVSEHLVACRARHDASVKATEAEAKVLTPMPTNLPSEAFDDISHVDDGRPPV
ncbi:MAG: hypothetical protein WC250_02780 [Candidatus Paceibacterota bacterium]|jgi:hypothetical protein